MGGCFIDLPDSGDAPENPGSPSPGEINGPGAIENT